jgi:hypothetical protein
VLSPSDTCTDCFHLCLQECSEALMGYRFAYDGEKRPALLRPVGASEDAGFDTYLLLYRKNTSENTSDDTGDALMIVIQQFPGEDG